MSPSWDEAVAETPRDLTPVTAGHDMGERGVAFAPDTRSGFETPTPLFEKLRFEYRLQGFIEREIKRVMSRLLGHDPERVWAAGADREPPLAERLRRIEEDTRLVEADIRRLQDRVGDIELRGIGLPDPDAPDDEDEDEDEDGEASA